MPFYWFVIGSVLLVLGLTFEVTAVTSGLTEMKNSAAGKKFRNVGIVSIICGFLVFLVALKDMVGNERNAMLTAGLNIVGLGVMTVLQSRLNSKNQKVLGWAAWFCIIVGFLLCIIYELALYHNRV